MGARWRRALAISVGGMLGASLATASCQDAGVFVCSSDAQCESGASIGHCEDTGFCSFPDGACPSGSRYGDHSGTLSGECVGDGTTAPTATDAADGSGADDGASTDGGLTNVDGNGPTGTTEPDPTATTSLDGTSTGGPPVTCGDGAVDPGEDCDDGNRIDGDGCNADCTPSGEIVWELIEDGGARLADGAASVDIGSGDEIYVGAWFTHDTDPELALRKLALDGSIDWTTSIVGPDPWGSIFAWGVAVGDAGNPVIAGDADTPLGGQWVVAQLDDSGDVMWQSIESGEAYGIGIGVSAWACGVTDTGEGRVVAYDATGMELHRFEGAPVHPDGAFAWDIAVYEGEVALAGRIAGIGSDHAIASRVSPAGVLLAEIELDTTYSQALAIAHGPDAWWLVGRSEAEDAGWIAQATPTLDSVATPTLVEPAGVSSNLHGVAVGPSGEVVAVGWQTVDGAFAGLVQRYTPDGELSWSRVYDRDPARPEYARDAVVASDGSIVVVGHVGALNDTGDFWAMHLTP